MRSNLPLLLLSDDVWNVVKLMAANETSVEQPDGTRAENAAADAEPSEDAAGGSQNGMSVCQTDRFGFCGGHQYTDPTRYVIIVLFL